MTKIAIASCQSQSNNYENSTFNRADCRAIGHKVGETEVCGEPQRVAVLGPYVLEPLLALGVQPVAYGSLWRSCGISSGRLRSPSRANSLPGRYDNSY